MASFVHKRWFETVLVVSVTAVVFLSKTAVKTAADETTTSGQLKQTATADPAQAARAEIRHMNVQPQDWPQWAGWSHKNNVPGNSDLVLDWDVESGKNIKWTAKLGSQTYGNPVVANGKVFVGTNNGAGYVKRFPPSVDLGCLLCFDAHTGRFLWQHSNRKLKAGAEVDWPEVGVCSAPYVDGDRLWYVNNRGELCCLDTEGFYDKENDGPFQNEPSTDLQDADVIWKLDMMKELGVRQHNMSACSVTAWGEVLFVNTSNGVDESHERVPAPTAPSFIAVDRRTGRVLWTDNSPGKNILHGQWSSPSWAEINGQVQVLFAGGDGWLYSFAPLGDGHGHSKLIWKFDCNPKTSKWVVGGRGDRNNLIATPVVYHNRVYIAVGQDPEQGEGIGHLWCIDPTKQGDVSPELAVDAQGRPLPPRRVQAVNPAAGEKAVPNPNSALVWHYSGADENGDGKIAFEEEMHRSLGSVAVKDDLLYIADHSGILHCLDARTGRSYWSYDLFAAAWSTPVILGNKVLVTDEDGDVAIFQHSRQQKLLKEINMQDSIYTTPVFAEGLLYIATRSKLYAIQPTAK